MVVSAYNRLVELRKPVQERVLQIDVQLKRRYDLIPNLVETGQGYLKHERPDAGGGDRGAQPGQHRCGSARPPLRVSPRQRDLAGRRPRWAARWAACSR